MIGNNLCLGKTIIRTGLLNLYRKKEINLYISICVQIRRECADGISDFLSNGFSYAFRVYLENKLDTDLLMGPPNFIRRRIEEKL